MGFWAHLTILNVPETSMHDYTGITHEPRRAMLAPMPALSPDARLDILLHAAQDVLGHSHDACFELREVIYSGSGYGHALRMLRKLSPEEQRSILETYADLVS